MKILFEDLAVLAGPTGITSPNESPNYPAANLADPFLRKRYQNIAGVDVVTITLPADKTVNCFFCGYHNASDSYRLMEDGQNRITEDDQLRTISSAELVLRLYDYTGALLHTETMQMTAQFEAVYFTDVPLVRYATITVDWSGVGAGYLGGAGFGQAYEMPGRMLADWNDEDDDVSPVSESSEGQILQDYIEPRKVRVFNFIEVPSADCEIIRGYLYNLGRMRPMWVDFSEIDHASMLPGYYSIVKGLENKTRESLRDEYSFTITFKEAR